MIGKAHFFNKCNAGVHKFRAACGPDDCSVRWPQIFVELHITLLAPRILRWRGEGIYAAIINEL